MDTQIQKLNTHSRGKPRFAWHLHKLQVAAASRYDADTLCLQHAYSSEAPMCLVTALKTHIRGFVQVQGNKLSC